MTDETDMSREAWIEDACKIFDDHAESLGWSRHIYSDHLRALLARIERLNRLVEIGDVRCEQCAAPATTLDGYGDPACEACCDAGPDMEDTE
jgi:hypothetical protein